MSEQDKSANLHPSKRKRKLPKALTEQKNYDGTEDRSFKSNIHRFVSQQQENQDYYDNRLAEIQGAVN